MNYPLVADTWGEEEREAAIAVIRCERVTMGEKVRALEDAFAAKLGVEHAVMVNSGSSANLIAVAALVYQGRLRRGDEVIVPAVAWATTYAPLQQHGLRLRVVDIDAANLGMDGFHVKSAISRQTKMVVAVNILGHPCDLDEIREFCDDHAMVLFEDNCESLGASLKGRPCGTWGDIATHSFFFSHHVSTGEGGMITTHDRELADLCRCLRAHGWARDLAADSCLRKPADPDFGEAYQFLIPGYNVRPLEVTAAVGLVQLRRLDRMLEARRRNAEVFQALFPGYHRRFFTPITGRSDALSSWFAFPIIPNEKPRSAFLPALRSAGIEVRPITGGNFLQHPAARHYDYDVCGTIYNAKRAHDRGFFVGNHPIDLTVQLQRLRDVLDEASR